MIHQSSVQTVVSAGRWSDLCLTFVRQARQMWAEAPDVVFTSELRPESWSAAADHLLAHAGAVSERNTFQERTLTHTFTCVFTTHARTHGCCNTRGERAGSARWCEMWSICGVAVVSSRWCVDITQQPRRTPPKRPHSQRIASGPRVPAAPSASGLIPVSTGRHWRRTTLNPALTLAFQLFTSLFPFCKHFSLGFLCPEEGNLGFNLRSALIWDNKNGSSLYMKKHIYKSN